jgi:hypothetical protein
VSTRPWEGGNKRVGQIKGGSERVGRSSSGGRSGAAGALGQEEAVCKGGMGVPRAGQGVDGQVRWSRMWGRAWRGPLVASAVLVKDCSSCGSGRHGLGLGMDGGKEALHERAQWGVPLALREWVCALWSTPRQRGQLEGREGRVGENAVCVKGALDLI